ncbi:MAG: monovalent cation:proton antiporter-2 (CPA2) family protein [Xanthomonadaceae bacterium]|jgi:glutathione-regulated potassium-efflux system protein KefB|nr:monovalent cation:proton antiporter-2 (CPA2) family protein [Xanthomonadaceae bacterium]
MSNIGLELVLVLLLAAIIAVPAFKKLGLGAVLAYLITGVVLGPNGFGFVRDPDRILNGAEIGVVMLLFVIGLELSPARLKLMRRSVFGIGSMQVSSAALVLGLVLWLYGLHWKGALVAGIGLALSSTAAGLQLLAERKELNDDYGRLAFAVLLFQDLVAIPLLAVIPLLGGVKNQTLTWEAVLHALAALALVVIGGHLLLRHVLRVVARTQMPEVFTATALLVVLGSAWIMQRAGLSPGLGAFLAGVLLADSEYRHELESQIEPFKGLLLGLFFIAVGMSIDLNRIIAEPWLIVGAVALLLTVKFGLLFGIARLVKLSARSAIMLGGVLWLGGEFAFVVFNEALRVKLISPQDNDRLVAVVGVSMALMPLMMFLIDRLLTRLDTKAQVDPPHSYDQPEDSKPQVLIAGMGRFGQVIARLLAARQIPYVALESSAERVENIRRLDGRIYYGDPARPDLLRAAGGEHVQVFVVCINDPNTNLRTVRLIRRMYPAAKVLARARNRQHAWRLMDLGAEPFREVFGTSLEVSKRILTELGASDDTATDHVRHFRLHDERLLREQYLVYDDEAAVIQSAREAQHDLRQLFDADLDAVKDTSATRDTDGQDTTATT